MKATIARTEFAAALAALAPAIPTRPTSPVLACIRIKVEGGTAMLTATDYEITIERSVNVVDSGDGEVLVSGLRLRDLVSKFSATTVQLEADGSGVAVTAGRSTYRLRTLPPSEYPATPTLPAQAGQTDAASFTAALRAVSHAANGDQEATAGVFVEVADGELWLAATDSYQLGACPAEWTGQEFSIRAPLQALNAAVKNMNGTVAVHVDDSTIAFVSEAATVTLRQIGTEGASWRRAMDSVVVDHTYTFPVVHLLEALDRSALVVDQNRPVLISISTGVATFTTTGEGAEGGEEIDVDGDGEVKFGVAPSRLRSVAAAVDDDTLTLGAPANPERPLTITSPNTPAAHVLMPIRRSHWDGTR